MSFPGVLLLIEVIVLLGPLTCFVTYSTLMAVTIGYPGLFMSLFDPMGKTELKLLTVLLGLPPGIYALFHLWSLALRTVKGRVYTFNVKFRVAFVCGVIASIALTLVYKKLGVLFGVIPAYVALSHMVFVQIRRRSAAGSS